MLLQADDLAFGYDNDLLFEGVSFMLRPGDRMALVAPNGQGKSTLLKIIAGELSPDSGAVRLLSGARLGFHRQSLTFPAGATMHDVLIAPFAEARAAQKALEDAQHAAENDLDALAKAQERYEQSGADAIERELQMLAAHVGFSPAHFSRTMESLSGGERVRVALAATLAEKPDVLLLDEPTNHLDLETQVWLEGHLRAFKGAIVIVSHDRRFMDAVCPLTAELGLFRFRFYPAPYSQYLLLREEELARERREFELQRAKILETEDFIRRNLAGNKTKQAKSRRTQLSKLVRVENPEDIWADAKSLGLRFVPAPRSGDIVLECRGLKAAYGERQLFSGVDLLLRRKQRLCIVGPNGAGKSTLLRLLTEQEPGANVLLGYFDQHLDALDPRRSAIEEVREMKEDMSEDAARQYLSRFQFFGDDPFRPSSSLSGGERTRLALAKMLLRPKNLLLLDEPTNHLDIPACEILEEALRHFEGTVVVVSHDRWFLERVSTHTLYLADGKAEHWDGSFTDFMERHGLPLPVVDEAPKPVDKRASYEQQKANKREEEKRARKIAELEKKVSEAEARVRALEAELAAMDPSAWQKMAEVQEKIAAARAEADRASEEWLTLTA